MGNREALLAAAKRCLLEKGYERATARDIAAAAGVSLAAIGYHFRSMEALLTEALLLAMDEWERDFRRALEIGAGRSASPRKRFESTWARLIRTFETHRALWVANFELLSQMDRHPEIRRAVLEKIHFARTGLASLFLNRKESAISPKTAQTVGAFHHALLTGMVAQWLIDPAHSLSARRLTDSLLAVADSIRGAPARKKKSATRSHGLRLGPPA